MNNLNLRHLNNQNVFVQRCLFRFGKVCYVITDIRISLTIHWNKNKDKAKTKHVRLKYDQHDHSQQENTKKQL